MNTGNGGGDAFDEDAAEGLRTCVLTVLSISWRAGRRAMAHVCGFFVLEGVGWAVVNDKGVFGYVVKGRCYRSLLF